MNNKKYKLSILIAVCLASSAAYSATDHAVTIYAQTSTTGATLLDGQPIKLGEKLGLQQNITQHVYYSLSATIPQQSNYTVETDIGLKTAYKHWLPFTELEASINHQAGGKYKPVLDYDLGTAYQLTDKIYPLVGVDSLGLRNNDALKYGVSIQCTRRVNVTVDAIKLLRHAGSAAQIKLGVTL